MTKSEVYTISIEFMVIALNIDVYAFKQGKVRHCLYAWFVNAYPVMPNSFTSTFTFTFTFTSTSTKRSRAKADRLKSDGFNLVGDQ